MATIGGHDAARLLADALRDVGLRIEMAAPAPDQGSDLTVVPQAGPPVRIEVKRLSLADGAGVRRQIESIARHGRRQPLAVTPVLVADRVTEEARALLRKARWGWLDLRGHLHLVSDGVFIDAQLPRMQQAASCKDPLAGRVGLEVASSMLIEPQISVTVCGLAR